MADSKIEWTNRVWNPIRGCSTVSEGCRHCYAMKQAHRFSGRGMAYEGLTKLGPHGPEWTGKVRLVPEMLDAPLRWKKPSRVFVNSMSDLFHEDVPDEYVARVFAVMMKARQHTFQILTKRPERMCALLGQISEKEPLPELTKPFGDMLRRALIDLRVNVWSWPLRNVWLGVSVEDQKTADERIPLLLQTPASLRWVSYEPALGPVNFAAYVPYCKYHSHLRTSECACSPRRPSLGLDWIVVGGESGPGARPFDIEWARSTIRQCKAAEVPVFVKQVGRYPWDHNDHFANGGPPDPYDWPEGAELEDDYWPSHQGEKCRIVLRDTKGGDPSEWPEDLRVREWPG